MVLTEFLLNAVKATTIYFFCVLSYLALSDGALLLWSTRRLQIPALKLLEREDFEEILNDLEQPNLLSFTADFGQTIDFIPRKLGTLQSAYVPMTNFLPEDSQELTDDLDANTNLIKEALEEYKKNDHYENVAVAIFFNNNRVKREDPDKNATEPTPTTTEPPIIPEYKGPVVYNGENSMIIYSAQAPRLRINSTNLTLGPSNIVAIDVRDGYKRLTATVILDDRKVILRFKFPVSNGYWSLTSVEVLDQQKDETKSYNLTVTSNVGAANLFSYHCYKDTVFKDSTGNVELVLYKMQVQPDAKKGRFSDAYNCVNFMTGPIWSGILVTASLIIGFFIALAALSDIKTMDKFDNYRTKQLNITVAE